MTAGDLPRRLNVRSEAKDPSRWWSGDGDLLRLE